MLSCIAIFCQTVSHPTIHAYTPPEAWPIKHRIASHAFAGSIEPRASCEKWKKLEWNVVQWDRSIEIVHISSSLELVCRVVPASTNHDAPFSSSRKWMGRERPMQESGQELLLADECDPNHSPDSSGSAARR